MRWAIPVWFVFLLPIFTKLVISATIQKLCLLIESRYPSSHTYIIRKLPTAVSFVFAPVTTTSYQTAYRRRSNIASSRWAVPPAALANDFLMSSVGVENALRFARTSPDAVVLSLWPSADGQITTARSFLEQTGATIVFETDLVVPKEVSSLMVMDMYWGEDWLETNCWYGEQPLENLGIGLRRPTGYWPGAKWKKELCFRGNGTKMHVLVANISSVSQRSSLWSNKYLVRAEMSRDSGHAGNSCMHLTDDQSSMVGYGGSHPIRQLTGIDCNASYAFACARCLLNPGAMYYLNQYALRFPQDKDRGTGIFYDVFDEFCKWLGDKNFDDTVSVVGDNTLRWSVPPI